MPEDKKGGREREKEPWGRERKNKKGGCQKRGTIPGGRRGLSNPRMHIDAT